MARVHPRRFTFHANTNIYLSSGVSIFDVSRMHMTPSRVSPATARPSGYVEEPSASNVRYVDTAHPPDRSYDVVREAPIPAAPVSYAGGAGQASLPQDVSSGFGSGVRPAVCKEPITTARAVPSTAEPPSAVYTGIHEPQASPTTRTDPSTKTVGASADTPVPASTGQETAAPGAATSPQSHSQRTSKMEHAPSLFPVGVTPHEGPKGATLASATTQTPSSNGPPPPSDQGRGEETSRSVSRGRTRRGKMGQKVKEELREAETEVKEKSKGFFPRLSGFFRKFCCL